MEFQLLGGVELRVDGRRESLGPARQRCVVAVLLIEANTAVSIDQLIDRVWADGPPRRVRSSLYSYLTRLRRALAPARVSIVRRAGNYVLTVDEQTIDLHRFRQLVGQARTATDDEQALALLEQALRLWRGEPFAGLDTPWLHTVRTTLQKERLAAELDRNDVKLRVGQHATLLSRLPAEAATRPLDERLAGQLMLALYRSGRQADALCVFHEIRQRLIADLGIEPGPDLRQLQGRILRADRDLAAPAAPIARRHNNLPTGLRDFTGRRTELDQLLTLVPEDPQSGTGVVISSIDGMAGIGKTALAVHAAHRLTDRYPDAQLFIDLHGHTAGREPSDPATALDTLLRTLGMPGERIPNGLDARASLWRAALADRRAILVLDNATSADQVRLLLPGNPGCLVLITSRHRLTDLESTRTLSLDALPPEDAVALFARVLGDGRATAETGAAAREIVKLCGYLPLAIRITAARLRTRPAWTTAYLNQRLRNEHRRLGELSIGARGVVSAFTLSYQHLNLAQQRLFRLLGRFPGVDVDAYAAAAMADLSLDESERLLEELLDAHLLQQSTVHRYRFHDLVRTYAAQLETDSDVDRNAAMTRVLDYYLHTAATAMETLVPEQRENQSVNDTPSTPIPALPDYDQASTWLEIERANLIATAIHAANHGWPTHTVILSTTLAYFLTTRCYFADALTLQTHAVTAARKTGDQVLEGGALVRLGEAHYRLDHYEEALTHFEHAHAIALATGNRHLEGDALAALGAANNWPFGRYEQALTYYEQALTIARTTGNRHLEGDALAGLGDTNWPLGRHEQALTYYEQALTTARTTNNRRLEASTLSRRGHVYLRIGRYEQARTHYQQALALARGIGNRHLVGVTLAGLGDSDWPVGRHEQALTHYQQALTTARALGDQAMESFVLHRLGRANDGTGRYEHARTHYQQALTSARAIGNRDLETEALNGLGETACSTNEPALALAQHQQALAFASDTGNRYEQARAHSGIAHAQDALDCSREAHQHWQQALAIYNELNVPEGDNIRALLNKRNQQAANDTTRDPPTNRKP